MERAAWVLLWLGAASAYPVYGGGGKRYGLVPLGPRLYYEPDPTELYYPSDYRVPMYYDLLPYNYYPEETEEEQDDRDDDWGYSDTNRVFLRNLILAQMYQDAVNRAYGRRAEDYDEGYVYGEEVDQPSNLRNNRDEEVRELKSLPKSSFREQNRRSYYPDNKWTPSKREGQEEVAVGRAPPQPAPAPRSTPAPRHARTYQPSPYDSIKRLLNLQDKMENEGKQPKKRSYAPSEESLVEQLGSLKKSA